MAESHQTDSTIQDKPLLIGGHLTLAFEEGGKLVLEKGITSNTVFQCFLHNRQAHYSPARVVKWKESGIKFIGYDKNGLPTIPRMVHASYVTVPWSEKGKGTDNSTADKSIEDIRYTMQSANAIGIQYFNLHLSKELHAVHDFESIIKKCLLACEQPCTILFENVGNLPATSIRTSMEAEKLMTPIQKLRKTGQIIEKVALDISSEATANTPRPKPKWGLCFDTAHGFVTGQPLTTKTDAETFIKDATNPDGTTFIKAFHLNGSLSNFNSGKDLHATTMEMGTIEGPDQIWGKNNEGLKILLRWAREKGIFIILERPSKLKENQYLDEIDRLKKLSDSTS